MYGLGLFTGVGGITLALQEYVKPLAYCEIEPYCQSTLLQRMQEGNLPKAPIWDDVRTLPTSELPRIDIIYGGFPCQNISVAGRQEGLEGDRSILFFEILRLIDETQAPFIFLENVPNIRTKGAERVCKELSERGYDCRWCNISAADVGARHKRERWFLLGYSKHNGLDATKESGSVGQAVCNDKEGKNETCESKRTDTSRVLAHTESAGQLRKKQLENNNSSQRDQESTDDTNKKNKVREQIPNSKCEGLQGQCKSERTQPKHPYISDSCGWTAKSEFRGISNGLPEGLDSSIWEKEWEGVPRVISGLPNRVNRIKALGNSVVPLQVRTAFEILMMKSY